MRTLGAKKFLAAEGPHPSWLSVRGHEILERHIANADGANPEFLASYLRFVETLAPDSRIHLIYRGHSFQAAYDPATSEKDGIAPFVFSYPAMPYGVPEFAEG